MGDDQPHSSDAPERGWKATPAARPGARPPSHRHGKLFAVLAVMLALAGAIIGLLFWLQPFQQPFFLSIPVTEYEPHYPPNPLAEQDSDALLVHFPLQSKVAFENQERERLRKELKNLAARRDEPVVVHLCTHAISHGGEVYLLPANANPDEPTTWLALGDVLEELRACPSPHKLLILDIMRPLADPRLGVLADQVAEQVETLLKQRDEKKELPGFVLCACSRGQFSLVSEDLGQSVFGHYLAEALRGYADGYSATRRRDSRVSVKELYEYVRARVPRWARTNRGSRQTPVLFGQGDDFPLVALAAEPTEPQEPAAEPEASPEAAAKGPEYPDWLRKGWELRDRWWGDESYRLAPRVFRELEANLLRAEQRWRGGIALNQVQLDLNVKLSELTQELDQVRPPPDPRPPSLAAAVRGLALDPAPANDLRALLAQADLLPASAATSLAADKAKFLDRFKEKPLLLAWTVFQVAADDPNPSRKKLLLLGEFVQALRPPPYREIELLRRLAEVKPDEAGKWPAEAVQQALQVARAAEQALAAGPEVLPWIRPLLEAAQKKRREGERLLLTPGSEALAGAPLGEAERQYEEINRVARAVEEAQRAYDAALAQLPGYALYLVALPEFNPQDLSDWSGAVRAAGELSGLLARPAQAGLPPADHLAALTQELRRHLQGLEQPFGAEALKDLLHRAVRTRWSEYVEMQALLASPRLPARARADLWGAQRQLGRRLSEEVEKLDRAENRDRDARTSPPSDSAGPPPGPSEGDRAQRRARLAIDLLKLGGLSKVDELEKALPPSGEAHVAWEGLGDRLRIALGKQLPSEFDQALDRQDWVAADRLSRVFPPFDHPRGSPGDLARNPTFQLRKAERAAYQQWLEEY